MTCNNCIKQLDQRLLENYQKAKQNNIQDSEIVDYILDQKKYFGQQVEKRIKEKEQELQIEYQKKLRLQLNIFLKEIFHNIKIIYDITRQKSEMLRRLWKKDDKKEDYDSKLFLLKCQCIQGQKLTKEQLQNIRQDQKKIFEKNYNQIKNPVFWGTINDSEKKFPLLKPLIKKLYEILEVEIQNCFKEPLVLKQLKVQEHLNKIKVSMNGCKESCPLCKRKCDQPNDSNHKHSCQNGHQLRGMNGVLIKNRPSLYTCEEIDDNSLISIQDSTIQKKWSEIKKVYSDWRFNDLKDKQVCEVKEKMMNIWNSGIGQLVCQQLSYKLNMNIQFQKENEDQSQSIHYILMLDDSYSMNGEQWENAKNGALQCMQDIAKNREAKVSVIIFNHQARVVIDCEKIEGGCTSFNNAFLQAYDQLQKHLDKKLNKIIILFYTDGGDSYPEDAANKFFQLPQNTKETVQLVSCADGDLNQIESLVQLTDNFNKSGISAELKHNFDVKDLKKVLAEVVKVWAEVVNQNYHNINF